MDFSYSFIAPRLVRCYFLFFLFIFALHAVLSASFSCPRERLEHFIGSEAILYSMEGEGI